MCHHYNCEAAQMPMHASSVSASYLCPNANHRIAGQTLHLAFWVGFAIEIKALPFSRMPGRSAALAGGVTKMP